MLQRHTAYKLQANDIMNGKTVFDGDRFIGLDCTGKKVSRINLLGNVIDKYLNEEKRYCALTLDDGSGQIRIKGFSDQFELFQAPGIGDTLYVIGLVKYFNDEVYIMPEIIRQVDPEWLNVRRSELGIKSEVEVAVPSYSSDNYSSSSHSLSSNLNYSNESRKTNYLDSNNKHESNDGSQYVTEKIVNESVESPKFKALSIIKKRKEIDFNTLISELKTDQQKLNVIVNELITEGEIYEMKPGYLCSIN